MVLFLMIDRNKHYTFGASNFYHDKFHQMQKEERMQNKFHIHLNGNCTRLYKNNTTYK